jgi:hypothetical protein
VLADEAAVLGQHLGRAVEEEAGVRQLAPAFRGVDEQRADAAVDVEPGVGLGGSRFVRQLVQPRLSLVEIARQPFSRSARSWKVSARNAGPPTRRA